MKSVAIVNVIRAPRVTRNPSIDGPIGLLAGDIVEVRSKEEILKSLDANGCFEGVPFMPEMFQYCGRRMKVYKRAHKTCDFVTNTGSRRLSNSVHLQDSR